MNMPTVLLSTLLDAARARRALALAVVGSLIALVVLGWCIKLARDTHTQPLLLFTGVLPFFFLALLWPQLRSTILACLVALLLCCLSHRSCGCCSPV